MKNVCYRHDILTNPIESFQDVLKALPDIKIYSGTTFYGTKLCVNPLNILRLSILKGISYM